MLKIVESEQGTQQKALPFQGWALVRVSQKESWKSLKVPFTIGSHADNDIFVNAPTMRALSKIIVASNGQLVSVDSSSHETTSLQDLMVFGIEALGPFDQDPQNMKPWKRSLKLMSNKESNWYSSLQMPLLKKLLPRQQSLRLMTLTSLVTFMIGVLSTGGLSSNEIEDLSLTPISATAGNIVNVQVSSASQKDPYAKGATFVVQGIGNVDHSAQYILTLNLNGLDVANEISILLNEKVIGETTASLQCIDSFCSREFPIDAAWIKDGDNTIQLKHNAEASAYSVRSLFFRKMESASEEEKELAVQLIASAERYFEERHLLVKNIRNARDAIEEVERIISTRTGLDASKSKFVVAKKKVMDAFIETSKDLQFKLQKELKLGHSKQAIQIVEDMLKLYPDPTTKQNMSLTSQLKNLQETIK